MKKILQSVMVLAALSGVLVGCGAKENFQQSVQTDTEKFREYFAKRFAGVEFADYGNGVYAIDPDSREQWLEIEEFPPYELNIDRGKELFETPFANGKTYGECFPNGGIGIRQNYPQFDTRTDEVITLELAINRCRTANGESELGYQSGDLVDISAYMAFTSRDKLFAIEVPSNNAYKAYLKGQKLFYSKHGQLNLACADCHMRASGQKLRADIPGPALGQATGFPVYRSKWEGMGSLHYRYAGCMRDIRAKPFALQSEQYRNLEYFQTIMGNGLAVNGPSARK